MSVYSPGFVQLRNASTVHAWPVCVVHCFSVSSLSSGKVKCPLGATKGDLCTRGAPLCCILSAAGSPRAHHPPRSCPFSYPSPRATSADRAAKNTTLHGHPTRKSPREHTEKKEKDLAESLDRKGSPRPQQEKQTTKKNTAGAARGRA